MSFEFLDHTADLKIRASGKTLSEAFESVALGAVHFLTEDTIKKKEEHKIHVRGAKLESVLYDFLEELIYLIDTKGFLYAGSKNFMVDRTPEGDYELRCTALGDNYKSYSVKGDIKAVTYNDMSIEEKGNGFEVVVVLDI